VSTPTTPSAGDFMSEAYCICGFILDEYDGRYRVEYADPDTSLVVERCPSCGRDPNLSAQR